MTGMHLSAASDPLTAPTWATAIGTLVLAGGAIITAVFAFLAFRKQAAEVALLQDQARLDQLDYRRESEERRRQRAAMVYITTDYDPGLHLSENSEIIAVARKPSMTATVHNSGSQPVYDVRIHWVDAATGTQGGEAETLGTLPTKNRLESTRQLADGEDSQSHIPVAYFRDATGLRWTVLPGGELDEVDPLFSPGASGIATTAVARARDRAAIDAPDRLDAEITEF
jgi:hypothetical protein